MLCLWFVLYIFPFSVHPNFVTSPRDYWRTDDAALATTTSKTARAPFKRHFSPTTRTAQAQRPHVRRPRHGGGDEQPEEAQGTGTSWQMDAALTSGQKDQHEHQVTLLRFVCSSLQLCSWYRVVFHLLCCQSINICCCCLLTWSSECFMSEWHVSSAEE